jgi:hypothetical protein
MPPAVVQLLGILLFDIVVAAAKLNNLSAPTAIFHTVSLN